MLLLPLVGCVRSSTMPADDHAAHPAPVVAAAVQPAAEDLPAGASGVTSRLTMSTRHAEWAMVRVGNDDSVRVWVVYPERRTNAPVVIVVHEIFGLSTWIRGVADQLAADGFIAVAPDFLTGYTGSFHPDSLPVDSARSFIRRLDANQIQTRIDATARWAMALPAALPRYGIVGFCWGGSVVFNHAVHSPTLGAGVAYYGAAPEPGRLTSIRAPVLGLYGENDARVNATIAPTDSAMRVMGKTYHAQIFPGAGHGFLRQQDAAANLEATRRAWPMTLAWFRRHLEGA
ncbi:MAG TPA: dienelactone hydrolase family protein [Gemmatimonadaceae bacterium]|nr:dienelactone hydrolase family protein [Gemmatimonadaceae bacterium]